MIKVIFWGWLFVLLVLSITPVFNGNENGTGFPAEGFIRTDYLAHFMAYLATAGFFLLGQIMKRPLFHGHAIQKYTFIALLAAISYELIQILLPYRAFNLIDLGLNLAGVLTGVLIIVLACNANKTSISS